MTATVQELETALRRARVLAAKAARAAHRRLSQVNASGRPGRIMRRVKALVEMAVRFATTARALAAMLREAT